MLLSSCLRFCKIHVYILLGSQKTPESGRKVKLPLINGLVSFYALRVLIMFKKKKVTLESMVFESHTMSNGCSSCKRAPPASILL